jgi:hypothetical protein
MQTALIASLARQLNTQSLSVCEAVVTVLKRFHGDREVRLLGCETVHKLALDTQGGTHRAALGSTGACAAVIAAMLACSTDAAVSRWACEAVAELAGYAPNSATLAAAGACEAVAAAMREHSRSRDHTRAACSAVCKLAKQHANRGPLGAAGACEAVVAAVSSYSADAQTSVWACCAVAWLLHRASENHHRLLAAGACEHIVRALQQHYSTSADFAQHGCRAVYHLAQIGGSSIERLGTSCACEAVVGALVQYVAVAAVTEAACNAVQLLAYNSANKSTLRGLPTKRTLQRALSLHASNSSLVEVVQQAMKQISNK